MTRSLSPSDPKSARRGRIRFEAVAAQALALVPLIVGLIFGAVVLPRSVAPEDIPVPALDASALARVVAEDDARAVRVQASPPLPSAVRAVGSALRAFNFAEADHAEEGVIGNARNAIVLALREVGDRDVDALLDLRALQMANFLTEVRKFEIEGELSEELRNLGGTFVERMTKVGWCEHHHLALPDVVRRAAFKLTWNRTLLLDRDNRFALTLDEKRALYAFYFTHPHASEEQRARFESAIAAASDRITGARAEEVHKKAVANWLLTKISEFGPMDPTYPAPLARATALFMKQDYRGSAAIYAAWIDAHPGGQWTLRVQNHLRAALLAADAAFQ